MMGGWKDGGEIGVMEIGALDMRDSGIWLLTFIDKIVLFQLDIIWP
jgi:hypothetical protein